MRAVDELLRATARAEARHFWFRGFRWFVTPLVRRALANRSHARILDCGCGTGANLDLLARFGTTYGFDLSVVGLYKARQYGRRRLARASVAAAPFPSGAFDLVTSFDVLYSLADGDEAAALAEMFRLTRAGGYVLVNVAAMDVLRGNHSIVSREVRRYTRASLTARLTGAGFAVERITYTNLLLFFPLLARRTLERIRGLAGDGAEAAELAVPAAPINGAISAALFVESLWVRRFGSPFGSSLLCLARKPETPER